MERWKERWTRDGIDKCSAGNALMSCRTAMTGCGWEGRLVATRLVEKVTRRWRSGSNFKDSIFYWGCEE
ncbi:hypothetical protein HPP92_016086 [Vanilla planifolia]|uniref:Uncharacterized protein n=1 Tax=Vanilla planifolia TaxID=51239 RepID=A0A835QKE2_VANPL|nr:hypothetical protein HPP92_016086 [Vanilla planifolia]